MQKESSICCSSSSNQSSCDCIEQSGTFTTFIYVFLPLHLRLFTIQNNVFLHFVHYIYYAKDKMGRGKGVNLGTHCLITYIMVI